MREGGGRRADHHSGQPMREGGSRPVDHHSGQPMREGGGRPVDHHSGQSIREGGGHPVEHHSGQRPFVSKGGGEGTGMTRLCFLRPPRKGRHFNRRFL